MVPDGWLACEVLRAAVAVLSSVLGSRELHGAHYLSLGTEEGSHRPARWFYPELFRSFVPS